jgi:hypothetical protein
MILVVAVSCQNLLTPGVSMAADPMPELPDITVYTESPDAKVRGGTPKRVRDRALPAC